jgi:hypothetical protein
MPIYLKNVLPEFANELHQLLEAAGETELARQVDGLQIVERCTCHDDFCASFYTQPKPPGAYGPNHQSLDLDADKGMIILDTVNGVIAHVEVLYRDGIRTALLSLLPD